MNLITDMSVNRELTEKLKDTFLQKYHSQPAMYRAPGRINLIGEHTDYNNGFVLPAAIDKAIYFAASKNSLNKLRLFASDFNQLFETDMHTLKITREFPWANYLMGVAAQFQKKGIELTGIDCVFGGDIPAGAGLSSSAAIECGFALLMNDFSNSSFSRKELSFMAQKAEHEYAGVKCGIMDQFASMFGKEGSVIRLDCRDLQYELFPFSYPDIEIILCDTRVKHTLASSEYNTRREECEEGVRVISQKYPEVTSLRDSGMSMLNKVKDNLSQIVYKRCSFVIQENLRVENACRALLKNDLATFGKLMYETHKGLSDDYAVSCKELDILVNIAREDQNVLGARMMGGGFGGCTINLLKKEGTENFINTVTSQYKKITGAETEIYRVKITNGAGKMENSN